MKVQSAAKRRVEKSGRENGDSTYQRPSVMGYLGVDVGEILKNKTNYCTKHLQVYTQIDVASNNG